MDNGTNNVEEQHLEDVKTKRSLTLKVLVGIWMVEGIIAVATHSPLAGLFKLFVSGSLWDRHKWAGYIIAFLAVPVTFLAGVYKASTDNVGGGFAQIGAGAGGANAEGAAQRPSPEADRAVRHPERGGADRPSRGRV